VPRPVRERFWAGVRSGLPTGDAPVVAGKWFRADLIIGRKDTAIGTLVERSTRFVMLLHLPGRHDAGSVAAVMTGRWRGCTLTCAGR